MKMLGNRYKFDFVITEIGGTVGDIESLPYLESMRQLKWEMEKDALSVHLTYVPFLAAAKELKTKPTQHSVKVLQSSGIQPDVLVLRSEHELNVGLRRKVALFCNVEEAAVVQSVDVSTIYEVPLKMQEQKLDETILRKMGLPVGESPALIPWRTFLDRRNKATEEVKIALVGKYVELQDAYKSILESLSLAAIYNDRKLVIAYVQSEHLTEKNVKERLGSVNGVVICPGFGSRGIEGKFVAAQYAREQDIPAFGICLGMQCMAIEFARNVLGYADANSVEMDEKVKHNVIDIMEEQKAITNLGGTMRLGAYECVLEKSSKVYEAYGEEHIQERHRHRYEFNNDYRKEFEKAGMKCVGINPESDLVEIVEIPKLKWYLGTQFHPEYSSSILRPHPLFLSFIKAAIDGVTSNN
jgi:CTP synthase